MMIAVVNFTNGKKNVAIETILHWHISQTSSLYKKEEKKEIYPLLIFKNCYFLDIRGWDYSQGLLVFILCIG